MRMVRYTDDFVCLFQYEQEAQKFYRMLVERMKKFGLELAEDKSRIMPFGRYKGTKESYVEEPIALIGHDGFCEGL